MLLLLTILTSELAMATQAEQWFAEIYPNQADQEHVGAAFGGMCVLQRMYKNLRPRTQGALKKAIEKELRQGVPLRSSHAIIVG